MNNKKGNYKPRLTIEESKKVIELYLSGKTQDQIAETMERSRSTIRHILNRAPELGIKLPKYLKLPITYEHRGMEEQVLKSLPDNVLFQHSKEYYL